MDVINAAKMISECGSKLNKLAKDIAAQVTMTMNFFFSLLTFCQLDSSVSNRNQSQILLPMLIVS